jgi:hypothetical protein
MKSAVVLALLLAACGGDDSMLDGTTDADGDADADDTGDSDVADDDTDDTDDTDDMTPDAPLCPRPSLDQADLESYLMAAIEELAEAPRYTDTQRSRARAFFLDSLTALGLTGERVAFPSGSNISLTIPATVASPEPTLIIGAHFDTVPDSPGADDNASGSALVLALARFAKDLPCRRSAVEFIWFDREEEGLFGSRASAQAHDPADVRAVYTFDQLGYNADNDSTFELELPSLATQMAWQRAATAVGATLSVTNTGNTDHESFREAGYDAVGLSEEYVGGDTTPYYHTPEDTAATIDPGAMVLATKLSAQVMFDTIASETP